MNKVVRETREDRVRQLRACAETISERAEELIGDNKYSTGYTISIKLNPGEEPEIKSERTIFPIKVADLL